MLAEYQKDPNNKCAPKDAAVSNNIGLCECFPLLSCTHLLSLAKSHLQIGLKGGPHLPKGMSDVRQGPLFIPAVSSSVLTHFLCLARGHF